MSDFHVIPTWQHHESLPTCWCTPLHDAADCCWVPGSVWVHRLSNDGPRRIPEERDPGPELGGWQVVEATA